MNAAFKKFLIGFAVFIAIIFVFLGALFLLFEYEISWKRVNIGKESSPDGRYSVVMQSIGEALFFGPSHANVKVYDGKKVIESFDEYVYDDGGQFREENYSLEWYPLGVVITLRGCEQSDSYHEVFFDGRDSFEGYTESEVEGLLKEKYDISEIESIKKSGDGWNIKANGVEFNAENNLALRNNYEQEYFKKLTEEVFPELIGRSLSWDIDKGDSPAKDIYTPIIGMHGTDKSDIDAYCSDICYWLRYCFDRLPYDENKKVYVYLIPEVYGYQNATYYLLPYQMKKFMDDDSDFYNDLYTYLDGLLNNKYDYPMPTEEDDGGKNFELITLPSPNNKLPDGKLYNPFVIPEEAWSEDEKVYLKVGQGPDGDYYNEKLDKHPDGVYVSEDKGKTFKFLREE